MAARMEDVASVVALERSVQEASHWPPETYATIVSGGRVNRSLLLAWQADQIVGFAVVKVVRDEAELESVAVLYEARRAGIGRAFCGELMRWAWEQGASKMDLEVRASSAGARRLYERLGFLITGIRRRYYVDPAEDAVMMRLSR